MDIGLAVGGAWVSVWGMGRGQVWRQVEYGYGYGYGAGMTAGGAWVWVGGRGRAPGRGVGAEGGTVLEGRRVNGR